MTEIEEVLTVAVCMMSAGVSVGGIVFAVRKLWSVFSRAIGGPTWHE